MISLNIDPYLKLTSAPLEEIINEDPHVRTCLMFGLGKFQNGVLIEPQADFKFDPQDVEKLQEFRNKIWYITLCMPHANLLT